MKSLKKVAEDMIISARKDRKTAQAAQAAQAAHAAQSPSYPTIPSVERVARASTSSSKSIEKRLDYIECALKKLEFNLSLVDGDTEDAKEFDDFKKEIREKCKTGDDIDEFLRSMDSKRDNNRLKRIVNWLSFICSVIPLLNQTALPQILSTKFTSKEIETTYSIFQIYVMKVVGIFEKVLNGVVSYKDEIEMLDSALEVDFFPSIGSTAIARASRIPGLIASTAIAHASSVPGSIATQLPTIISNVRELSKTLQIEAISKGKQFSKNLCKNYNKILSTFLLSMFIYILLHSKIRLRTDNTHHNITDMFNTMNMTSFLKNSGGKKAKKSAKKR